MVHNRFLISTKRPSLRCATRSFLSALMLSTLLVSVSACGSADDISIQEAHLQEQGALQMGRLAQLPNFLSSFTPSNAHEVYRFHLGSRNDEFLDLYEVFMLESDSNTPLLDRSLKTLIVVNRLTQEIMSVTEGVHGYESDGNTIQGSERIITLTTNLASSFSVQVEKFAVGAGPRQISSNLLEGVRNRNGFEQETDACQFNQALIQYAESQVGNRVGNGECYTLAKDGLLAIGAYPPQSFYLGSTVATNTLAGAKPGDILQFDRLRSSQGWFFGVGQQPNHTSIIKSIQGSLVTVYEQNAPVGNPTTVNQYDFSTITSGTYVVFRAAPLRENKDQTCGPAFCPAGTASSTGASGGGFNWGNACDPGCGDFGQPIQNKAVVTVGTIAKDKKDIRIELSSKNDVDIRLKDKETGEYIIAWTGDPSTEGQLNGPQQECWTDPTQVEFCYSGYNGTDSTLGKEWIEIRGVTNRELVMEAFGYAAGTADIRYKWLAPNNCVDKGEGEFVQAIDLRANTLVGDIPAGKSDIRIELKTEGGKDVDVRVMDKETGKYVIAWTGLPHTQGNLNGSVHECYTNSSNITFCYSGYDGVGADKGHEYITISGTLDKTYVMSAFGYAAGNATVRYAWGVDDLNESLFE